MFYYILIFQQLLCSKRLDLIHENEEKRAGGKEATILSGMNLVPKGGYSRIMMVILHVPLVILDFVPTDFLHRLKLFH